LQPARALPSPRTRRGNRSRLRRTASGRSLPYNLRFPGQYYQAETGLNQNWNRDYDPLTGKYIESDPIGLGGGINTYTYVDANPLAFTDRSGLIFPNPLDLFPWPWSQDRCAALLQAINNATLDLERRYALIRSNPLNLPQWGPTSSSPNSASVNGHWREINRIDSQRRKNEDDYNRHCRNNCPPGSPAADSVNNDVTTPTAGILGVLVVIGGALVLL
jgi:RHS repeat-associated protein